MSKSEAQEQNPHGLTDRQLMFCKEYLIDLNATKAAERAGYSKMTANEQGNRLLANVSVQTLISELKQKRSNRLEISADRVAQELAKVAFVNIQDFIDGKCEIVNLSTLKRRKTAAIQSIEVKKTTIQIEGASDINIDVTKFKLNDKLRALELLGRHIGFFEKDNQQQAAAVMLYLPENGREKNDEDSGN